MKKFNVTIRQEMYWNLVIEAENEDEANEKAKDAMCDGNWGKPNGYENVDIHDIEEQE